MIKPLLLFILAYWCSEALIESRFFNWAHKKFAGLNRLWIRHAGLFFILAAAISFLFGVWNLKMLLALVLVSCCFYGLNKWIVPRGFDALNRWMAPGFANKDGLSFYLSVQGIHILVLYVVLFLAGQAEGPIGLLKQLRIFLFADHLVVAEELLVPSILVMLLFLTSIASEIVARFLEKFGNPTVSAKQEIAAAIEPSSEVIWSRKNSLIERITSDVVIEEQFEVSDDSGSPKIKESMKVQYHWYRKEDDLPKGKYIGILERLLVCVFVFYGIYQGLVLLGTMKTVARFKMFENKAFAEYYLIGTLLSLMLALVCGFMLRRLI